LAVGLADIVGLGVGWKDSEGGTVGALLMLGVKLGAKDGDVVFFFIVGEREGKFVGEIVGDFVGGFVGRFVGGLVNKAAVGAVVFSCATAVSIAAKARRKARLMFIFVV
jgi:hypothetical protein